MKRWIFSAVVAISVSVCSAAQIGNPPLVVQRAVVRDGVELHYVERGKGVPVVFVHGSLSDGGYWSDEVMAFARSGYRAIAYSRRHSPPNMNKPQPGYSAVTDAEDLAALIGKLHLGRVHVVGHSYGALTALFLAVRHPELVRSLVLAEAPAISLLRHPSGGQVELGEKTFADIQSGMVEPMKAAFRRGDRVSGLRTFIGFVMNDPETWNKMPEAARQDMLNHAREWDVMMTTGELFPELDPRAVRRIAGPVLMLSGENSYSFLKLTDEELERLLPHRRRIIIPNTTHGMWSERPEECRKAVLDFLSEQRTGNRPLGPQGFDPRFGNGYNQSRLGM
jgi:non-heme chloroperoxidase